MRKNQSRSGGRPRGSSRPTRSAGRPGSAKRGEKPVFGDKGRAPKSGTRTFRKSNDGAAGGSERPRGRNFTGAGRDSGGFSKPKRTYGSEGRPERPAARTYSKGRAGAEGSDRPRGRNYTDDRKGPEGFSKPRKTFGKPYPEKTGERTFRKSRDEGDSSYEKPRGRNFSGGTRDSGGRAKPGRTYNRDTDRRPPAGAGFERTKRRDDTGGGPVRSGGGKFGGDRKRTNQRGFIDKNAGGEKRSEKPEGTRLYSRPGDFKKSRPDTNEGKPKRRFDKRGAIERSRAAEAGDDRVSSTKNDQEGFTRSAARGKKTPYKTGRRKIREDEAGSPALPKANDPIRLNKYIANAGICSRREADDYIRSGVVSVNGVIVTELGHKVTYSDVVKFGERNIKPEKPVYILLNKPKDHITTLDDPEGRKTVSDLVKVKERVYPIGRLDRNTTGVLLLTNDGDMAERLMHPKYLVKKVYLATLDKRLSRNDMDALLQGVQLEDGPIAVDAIAYVGDDKKDIGVEIHSGRNRIVHRMFEFLGYKVEKLDRTSYAGITKQNLKKGAWRLLSDEELISLKRLVSLKGKY